MNRTILSGRICSAIEVKTIKSKDGNNCKVANYRLAVPRNYGAKSLDGADVDFIKCVAYNGFADFAEKNLAKGMKLMLEGKIHTGSYDDEVGKKIYYTEVIVDRQELPESKEINDRYRKYAESSVTCQDEGNVVFQNDYQEACI